MAGTRRRAISPTLVVFFCGAVLVVQCCWSPRTGRPTSITPHWTGETDFLMRMGAECPEALRIAATTWACLRWSKTLVTKPNYEGFAKEKELGLSLSRGSVSPARADRVARLVSRPTCSSRLGQI